MSDDFTKEYLASISGKIDKLDDKMDNVQHTLIKQEANFEQHEKNDRSDIQGIQSSLSSINDQLGEYNQQLETHIRNSESNTQQLKILQDRVIPLIEEQKEEAAIKKWSKARLAKITKILSLISVGIGVIISIVKLLGYF